MKISVKLQPSILQQPGDELVFFRSQMLTDIYIHEEDPFPTFEEFSEKWLTRPNGEMFWVYRQGTHLPSYLFNDQRLYVGLAKTEDLDEATQTIEQYYHVPTINLGELRRFRFEEEFPTLKEIRNTQEMLYKYLQRSVVLPVKG